MKLHSTSRYHPEGDGQTEHTNQTLKQYLRVYCNYQQDNWSELLPLAEFAYNNAPNATTGVTPFFANKCYHPNISVHPERDLASLQAWDFIVDLNELHLQLQKTISAAQTWYSASANKHRTPSPDFVIGDKVFVKSDHIRTTRPSKKLVEKYLGPFKIIVQASTHSFTLHLPSSMCTIHLVFHGSMLEPSTPNPFPTWEAILEPPVILDREPEYEISEILDSKIDKCCKCRIQYLVRWMGYEGTDEETSWLPASELGHASDVVSDFHQAYLEKPGPDSWWFF